MRVLLTGATGYIGSAVLDALISGDHSVTALVRDPGQQQGVVEQGGRPVLGDISDAVAIRGLAALADGVVHVASPGDETSARVEATVTTAVLDALAGTGKPFVTTAGVWDHGSGSYITEISPPRPPRITEWRPAVTERVRAATGIRGVVVAPALAYGRADNLLHVVADSPHAVVDGGEALVIVGRSNA